MREAKDIIPTLQPQLTAEPAHPAQLDQGSVEVVNGLFRELQTIFTGWRQAWPDDKALARAKRSWVKALMAANINRLEQIRFGLQQCRLHGGDFAPSPGRFIAWCTPTAEMLGLPSEERAFREACRNAHPCMAGIAKWSHEVVYHAACESGFANLNRLGMDDCRKLFSRNYTIALRQFVNGEKLRSMPLALPAKVDGQRTPEVGRAALAELQKKLKGARHG